MPHYLKFTKEEQSTYLSGRTGCLKKLGNAARRIFGHYQVEDQLRIACMCEPPMFFLRHGVWIPHAYGITLSVDEIGADCRVGQNVTIGASLKDALVGERPPGHKPRVGNMVWFFANSVVSGKIKIGDFVIVAASAFVDKDVPSKSIVYGHNQIKKLQSHHIKYLQTLLYFCTDSEYRLIPGLVYKDGGLFIDSEYRERRKTLMQELEEMKA